MESAPLESVPLESGTGETGSAADATAFESDAQGEHSAPETDATAATDPAAQPGNALTDDELFQSVTALIFASPDPLSEKRIAGLLEGPDLERVRAAIELLRQRLEQSGLPLELSVLAGGHVLLTAPRMGPVIQRLFKTRKAERVSPAALETLAVVAYRQPVTKAEIEAIRGVQSAPILRSLIDRGLVRVAGRSEDPGHPLHYGTTREFLDRFGLAGIEDLPRDSELAKD